MGDREFYLREARARIGQLPHTCFLRSSSIIETEPVGGPPQGKYLNVIWEIETQLAPSALKDHLLAIEALLGRRRSGLNSPREIDIDLLFYGSQIVEEKNLKIPHPRLQERAFVLEPLAELAPDLIHPLSKKTVKELMENLRHENRA